MRTILTRLVPPAELPVTLAEAKRHVRVDFDEDNDYITALIEVATADVEQHLGNQVLITQTWRADDVAASVRAWELPLRPVQTMEPVVQNDDGTYSTTFVVGYGAPADVPAPIRHAVLMMVGLLYNKREPVADREQHEVPLTVTSLLGKHRTQYV
jgi:hypothetical protein